jgi:hypothetical protein
LWYKQNWLYVPKGNLKDVLLKDCHDGPLVSHGGAKRTTTFLKKSYYWLNLKNNVEEYVKTCLTCQQNQILNKKQVGLLRPLLIPERPWETMSMDFMVSLPPSKGFDVIMVVVDRFSKMAHHSHQGKSQGLRDEKVVFHTRVQASWPSKGHCFGSKPKVHEQVLASPVEAHGVKAQDEHLIPGRWLRSTLKRRINNIKILWTSPNER